MSLLPDVERYSTEWIYHISFIPPSIHGHLGPFHLLAMANNVSMNTGVRQKKTFLNLNGHSQERVYQKEKKIQSPLLGMQDQQK